MAIVLSDKLTTSGWTEGTQRYADDLFGKQGSDDYIPRFKGIHLRNQWAALPGVRGESGERSPLS
jgi:hypothetical protein